MNDAHMLVVSSYIKTVRILRTRAIDARPCDYHLAGSGGGMNNNRYNPKNKKQYWMGGRYESGLDGSNL